MDPIRFLVFAANLSSKAVCDDETDARVGVDRCYYAVAHLLWGRLETYLAEEDPAGAAYDLERMKTNIHRVLREVLLVIRSSLRTRLADLWRERVRASYHMNASFCKQDLEDSLETAMYIARQVDIIGGELDAAYSKGLLDSTWWGDLRDSLRPADLQ